METSLKPGFHEWGYANIFVKKIILLSFLVFSIFFNLSNLRPLKGNWNLSQMQCTVKFDLNTAEALLV